MPTILVIEDDDSIRNAIIDILTGVGYEVISAANGEDGLKIALERTYHILLLDLILPNISGLNILRSLKHEKPGQAVIILSAMGQEEDRIKGLKLGADDYCVKPFSIKELLARIDAVLRRTHERTSVSDTMKLAGYTINRGSFSLHRNEEEIILSEKEFLLLIYLYQNQDRLVSKEELLQKIWHVKVELTDSRTAEMHISTLRKKLPQTLSITTKRGIGYQLNL